MKTRWASACVLVMAILLLGAVYFSCSTERGIEVNENGPFKINLHPKTLDDVISVAVGRGSQTELIISKFIRDNKDGWASDFVSHAPRLVIGGNGYQLLIFKTGTVVYIDEKRQRQFIKQVEKDKAQSLINALDEAIAALHKSGL